MSTEDRKNNGSDATPHAQQKVGDENTEDMNAETHNLVFLTEEFYGIAY
jgi:hypothetical protein